MSDSGSSGHKIPKYMWDDLHYSLKRKLGYHCSDHLQVFCHMR